MKEHDNRIIINSETLWPTPLWRTTIPAFRTQEQRVSHNEDMINRLKTLKEENDNVKKSNQGPTNWQSHTRLFKDQTFVPLCQKVSDVITNILPVKQMMFEQMWGQISGKGDWNSLHTHSCKYDMTAVYYLKAPVDGPRISFRDPRPSAIGSTWFNQNYDKGEWRIIKPNECDLYLFPSYLEHQVEPSQSDEERIMISMDIQFYQINNESEVKK